MKIDDENIECYVKTSTVPKNCIIKFEYDNGEYVDAVYIRKFENGEVSVHKSLPTLNDDMTYISPQNFGYIPDSNAYSFNVYDIVTKSWNAIIDAVELQAIHFSDLNTENRLISAITTVKCESIGFNAIDNNPAEIIQKRFHKFNTQRMVEHFVEQERIKNECAYVIILYKAFKK